VADTKLIAPVQAARPSFGAGGTVHALGNEQQPGASSAVLRGAGSVRLSGQQLLHVESGMETKTPTPVTATAAKTPAMILTNISASPTVDG